MTAPIPKRQRRATHLEQMRAWDGCFRWGADYFCDATRAFGYPSPTQDSAQGHRGRLEGAGLRLHGQMGTRAASGMALGSPRVWAAATMSSAAVSWVRIHSPSAMRDSEKGGPDYQGRATSR